MILEGVGMLAVLYVGMMLIFVVVYIALMILSIPLRLLKSHNRKKRAARESRERALAAYNAVLAAARSHHTQTVNAARTRSYGTECAAKPWLPRTPIPPAPTAADYARVRRLS